MGLIGRNKERLVLDVSNCNSNEGFVCSVRHHLPFSPKKCSGEYNLLIVPLSDGILTSIDRESFKIVMDTDGRLILTRKDGKVQLVFDYDKGFMTGILGGALYETCEIPSHEGTNYHG